MLTIKKILIVTSPKKITIELRILPYYMLNSYTKICQKSRVKAGT